MDMFVVEGRLCLTEDDRLVSEDDPDARWLYAIPGQEITMKEAEKYGLIKKPKPAEPKQAKPAEDKQAAKPADKKRQPRAKK